MGDETEKPKGKRMVQQELLETGRIAASQPHVHGSHNLSGKIEWYTPEKYIASARAVMGDIDTDPASSDYAQDTIQARRYYTIDDDGLTQPWSGTVWLNPPYAARIITPFIERLLGYLDNGDVTQAILLTHNNSDTAWAQKAFARCSAYCLTRGRVRFYNQDGTANSPTHGHCFFYFGLRQKRFCREFSQYGHCARRRPDGEWW